MRKDSSRTRTTMGITWPLLLSLSFFLHRVTSQAAPTTTIPNPNPNPTTKLTTEDPATKAGDTTSVTPAKTAAPVIAAATAALTTAATPTAAAVTTTATTAAATAAMLETKIPTETAAITHKQVTSTMSSQVSSASSTVANLAVVTRATVRPTTLNPPDKSIGAVKIVGTDKPVEHSTLSHHEGSSRQPTTTVFTPSDSNVFKTTLGTEGRVETSTALTNAGGSGANRIEMTSTAATKPAATRSQQGPKVTSGPGTTSITSDLNTPTPVVPTSSTARTRHEPLDTSSVRTPTTPTKTGPAEPPLKTFEFSLKSKNEEQREFVEVCKRLMVNLEDGKCILKWQNDSNKVQFQSVEITGTAKITLANQYHDELTKKPADNTTLIAILASCGALLIMIIILAVCASHHRRPYNETQQHLTEELHTVENGYHDNPTLEVMEVQPEMQEKKMALNGEFNDSWIVPIDNLLKEDVPDEEDTHL